MGHLGFNGTQMRPEAEGYVGNYVRAIHDFNTDLPGEVSLIKGEVFKVTKVIDKNWLQGKSNQKEGNFPTDFVEKLVLPLTENGQKVFAAVENFPALQDGDLEFRKGDVILGVSPIDDFWWHGRNGNKEGMFPVTHVIELEVSRLLKQRSKSVHSAETLFAQALVDAVGQLDEELSFQVGDIIKVTEVVDEDWYIGEVRGKSGMFLASCVQLLNEDECNSSVREDIDVTQTGTSQKYGTSQSSINHEIINKPNQQSKFVRQDNISTHEDVPSGNNINSDTVERTISYTSENTKAHNDSNDGVTPYGRTLYPFVGELSDELSFSANDIVTLIQHVDDQWIEGELDGKIGVFPSNYIEIVVDCPYAYDNGVENVSVSEPYDTNVVTSVRTDSPASVIDYHQDKVNSTDRVDNAVTNHSHEENYALVLYEFSGETEQDLQVHEGETVTVIKTIDENWILARKDNGQCGMVPVRFVEVIGAPPKLDVKSDNTSSDNCKLELKTIEDKLKDSDTAESFNSNIDENSNKQSLSSSSTKDSSLPYSKFSPQPNTLSYSQFSKSSSDDSKATSKPIIRQKPSLAPKPALKPKPSFSPKPWVPTSIHRPVSFNPTASIPKSTSSKTLSQYCDAAESNDSNDGPTMTKAQSMYEISDLSNTSTANKLDNNADTDINSQLSQSSRNSSDLQSNTNSSDLQSNRNSSDAQSKKTFENWDLSKPLDSIIKSELTKASKEAEVKMRSDSIKGTDSTDASKSMNSVTPRPGSGNYSRENFESEMAVGNSTFFVFDDSEKVKNRPTLRKPPPPPTRGESKDSDFTRRPSLKKPAPQRPVGPRIAPAPSRVPLVPARTEPSKLVPSRPAPAQPNGVPSRPQAARRKQTRPAPPRPSPAPSKSSSDNLMSFSPTGASNSTFHVDEDDNEAVLELRTRVDQLETEIKDFERSKCELEQMRDNLPEDTDSQEICDNIEFYQDNIDGYVAELKTLKDQLASLCPIQRNKMDEEKLAAKRKIQEKKAREEMRKKMEEQKLERKEKRKKVIGELIQTEKDFLTSLNLIIETFLSPFAEKHREVDVEHLLGNIEEVADVSQKLLTKLEDATNGKDFSEQVIGTCFVCLAEDMKNVYAPYCRNHDDVITLIEKYYQNNDIKTYLERLLDKLRDKHVVFDLEALLIKPVQRILKYPLLLNELIKSTEDSHPDKKETMLAISSMTNVATAINEYKRRKDLVYKYKKDTDVSLGDKLSKLSLHSIKKKSSRIKERFSANLGFIDQTRDSNFDKEETRYRHLEKSVRVFIKDIQLYLDDVQNVVGCQESIAADIEDFYSEKRDIQEVQRYQSFYNSIHMTFLPNFQVEVDELVVLPLNQMVGMFEGPNKVIQKRYDKLLDYDNMKRKAQNDKAFEKTLQTAKQNYEALNAQLLDELPKLYTLATQLFRDCVGSFVRSQREFYDRILQEMFSSLNAEVLHDESIIEQFNIQHTLIVDKLAMLSFMPKSFSPRVADQKQDKKNKRMSLDPAMLRSSEVSKQIDGQRIYVTQQYPKNKVYQVNSTHVAVDPLDISLYEGDVVGVIVDKDPMGNKERWFVDSGASKGFVPKKILSVYEVSPPRPVSSSEDLIYQHTPTGRRSSPNLMTPLNSNNQVSPGVHSTNSDSALTSLQEVDDMDFALEEEMIPDINEPGNKDDEELEQPKLPALYYAEFSFAARNENEVSLFEHQVVTVIAMHDQDGNTEWWYVEADGHYGYAPAAYLHKMESSCGAS
ncbi:hypothetical protein ACF0H5_015486 [Mactra antiquata]